MTPERCGGSGEIVRPPSELDKRHGESRRWHEPCPGCEDCSPRCPTCGGGEPDWIGCPDADVCLRCPCAAEDDACFPGERLRAELAEARAEADHLREERDQQKRHRDGWHKAYRRQKRRAEVAESALTRLLGDSIDGADMKLAEAADEIERTRGGGADGMGRESRDRHVTRGGGVSEDAVAPSECPTCGSEEPRMDRRESASFGRRFLDANARCPDPFHDRVNERSDEDG